MIRPEVILGPPGCGKTWSLLEIVDEELANDTHPSRIAFLSFTRRAANEAIERALTKFSGLSREDLPYFRTIHSLCYRRMGLSSNNVLEGKRLEDFGNIVGYKITGRFSLEDGSIFGFEKGDRLLFIDNIARVRQVPLRQVYDEDDDDLSFWEVERFSKALALYKKDLGLIDFTDMIAQFVESDLSIDIDVLVVDEAQDLSLLQWAVIRKLAKSVRRFVVAGDDDQAIYRWSGADVDTFIGMDGDVRVLSQSYRVPRKVQEVAHGIIRRVKNRRPKEWSPREDDGEVRWHASTGSLDLTGPDILVLGRNRYLLRDFEEVVKSLGLLYEFQGARSVKPSLLEAVLTWERLRQQRPGVSTAQCRKMYEYMSVGTGFVRGHKQLPKLGEDEESVTLADLHDRGGLLVHDDKFWFDALDKIPLRDVSYLRAARRRGENLLAPPRIRLSTIHGMKGGQADEVILLTDMASRTFREAERTPEDESRVWYVAVTRAKQKLHIVAPTTKRFFQI